MGTPGRRWARFHASIKIRLERSAMDALHSYAAHTGKPVAELAREAINRYLADVSAATPATGKDKP
jgi:predicted DNA-binding protein